MPPIIVLDTHKPSRYGYYQPMSCPACVPSPVDRKSGGVQCCASAQNLIGYRDVLLPWLLRGPGHRLLYIVELVAQPAPDVDFCCFQGATFAFACLETFSVFTPLLLRR
jgi:hypothetical protein